MSQFSKLPISTQKKINCNHYTSIFRNVKGRVYNYIRLNSKVFNENKLTFSLAIKCTYLMYELDAIARIKWEKEIVKNHEENRDIFSNFL